MISKINKNAVRQKRHQRVRLKISGTAETPRFNVNTSPNNINVQIIDDVKGATLVSCSTLDKDMVAKVKDLTKCEAANLVGKTVAEKALKAGITEVVFDRGGYLYTGRVKMVADGAREAGLKF